MVEVNYSKWNDIQNRIGDNCTLLEQITMAKGLHVEVPPEVLAEAETALKAKAEADKLEAHVRFNFGNKATSERVYLKTKGFELDEAGKTFCKGLYLETRALEHARAVLDMAIEQCRARGIPTSRTEGAANEGSTVPRRSTDKEVTQD
jgi:hypothetical protein